jgi:transcriptional regulator with XRE-family HTH domain
MFIQSSTSRAMHIGYKIKKLREIQNLTQEYIAGQLGISQRAYSKVETGVTRLTVERLTAIARILCLSESDLLEKSVEELLIRFLNEKLTP